MNIAKCENGHFYDADKNKICPRCVTEKQGRENKTHISARMQLDKKEKIFAQPAQKYKKESGEEMDENRTVSFYSDELDIDPVVGWLVCTKGEDEGESFALKSGRNFIGRGSGMDVVLRNDNSVSRKKHAIVLYEPRSRSFIAQPGESRELVYLNDELVLSSERLKPYDVLTVGNTELSFMPFCGPKFAWKD